MKRLLATPILVIFLSACTGLGKPPAPPLPSPEQALFDAGLKELADGGTSPALVQLSQRPASPWQQRAQTLLEWQGKIREQGHAATASLQQQLRACRSTGDKLSQENATLSHDLQELKKIMVEMEKRRK